MSVKFWLLTIWVQALCTPLFAQIINPVRWEGTITKSGTNNAIIKIRAKLDKGWHVYSQHLDKDNGPVATEIKFVPDSNYIVTGGTTETPARELYDDSYQMKLRYIEGEAVFTQNIQLKTLKPFLLKVAVTYMVCNNTDCLPPETIELPIPINGYIGRGTSSAKATIIKAPATKNKGDASVPKTNWGIFIAGFIGGLLALLTPCVFPIIPLTVNFFTKQSKTRLKGIQNALLYSLFIVLIYVGIGLAVTLTLGADALNALASNVWVNLVFFIVFVAFAFSFLGAFEIILPNSLVNKMDNRSSIASIGGIFFMALTLSLVSFSCTGPIVGSLLVQAAVGGNIVGPLIGMLGFATALSLPFGLFAAFPSWLNSLPKSGGWLNNVKIVLGLLELALSLKFISNVDLAYHWNIITREVFLALWIVIFTWMGLYLAGTIRFPHDETANNHIPLPRFALATLIFAFVIYLVPGMFGAPLKLISGFPPPQFYSEGFNLNSGTANTGTSARVAGTFPEVSAHMLPAFHDYQLGIDYAQKTGKPLLLDFTGWSCVNCRKMEDKVWADEKVLNTLRNDYVLVSLYVDDKEELPVKEQYLSVTGKAIKTVGNKWSDLQATRFKTNSQPYYVLIDNNGNMLSPAVGFNTDIEGYYHFLQNGLKKFRELNRKRFAKGGSKKHLQLTV